MATKKSFKENNPALSYISAATPEEHTQANKDDHDDTHVHAHTDTDMLFHNKGEAKTRRVQLLLKPSTHDAIKQLAQKHKTSVNDAINTILEHYLENTQ